MSGPTAVTEEYENRYWFPFALATSLWVYGLFLVVVGAVASVFAPAAIVFFVLVLFALPVAVYCQLYGLVAYYWDAKDLRRSENAYRPSWIGWTIAHGLLGVVFVGPLYIWRRRQNAEGPTIEEFKAALPLVSRGNPN